MYYYVSKYYVLIVSYKITFLWVTTTGGFLTIDYNIFVPLYKTIELQCYRFV